MKYGILRYPHQNKRYFDSTKDLLECELGIMVNALKADVKILGYEFMGGIEVFCFEIEALHDDLIQILYDISSNYVLFKIEGDALIPFNEGKSFYFKEDMSSILKYSGKTNEAFTSMMINMGVYSSNFKTLSKKDITIFDPMCGRGTTLYQGLILGYNVAGIDIDYKSTSEINKFLRRYLKFHKYKHTTSHQTIVIDKKKKGVKYTFETADTVDHFKKNDKRTIMFADGDTTESNLYFKKNSFHVIVSDLPYGVQHSGASKASFMEIGKLLQKAIEEWKIVLKKGGTVVLSYNTFNIKRKDLIDIFEAGGLKPMVDGYYEAMEHWVEQAVSRDVFVAKYE